MTATTLPVQRGAPLDLHHQPGPDEEQLPWPLPSATPLSHSSPALRSEGPFDPSELLCSLLPSPLASQTKQLADYDQALSRELEAVVEEEYKDFIDLAAKLGGERQRIDRLANWAGSSGQHGLEGVRICVEEERDEVVAAQLAVQRLLHSRQSMDTRRAELRLLLSLSDIVHRLESLLLIPSAPDKIPSILSSSASQPSSIPIDSNSQSSSRSYYQDDNDLFQALNVHEDADGYSSDESGSTSSNSSRLAEAQPRALAHPPSEHISAKSQPQLLHTGRNLDLPTRISRAKTTWESLGFLRQSITNPLRRRGSEAGERNASSPPMVEAADVSPFLVAYDNRLLAIKATLKGDLRSLFSRLMTPGALLVDANEAAGLPPNRNSLLDLHRWSRITTDGVSEAQVTAAKAEERKGWMKMIIETWVKLEDDPTRAKVEIQDHLRTKLVAPWCHDHVQLPDGNGGQPPTAPLLHHTDGSNNMTDGNLQSPFDSMFNGILLFVQSLRELIALLDSVEVGEQPYRSHSGESSPTVGTDHKFRISPFEDVLWTEISKALTEQVGDRLFYVGSPNDFHNSYLATQRFLDSLALCCPSVSTKKAWLSHPSLLAFKKRWQISVYFQMRYRTIASSLEAELSMMPKGITSASEVPSLPFLNATRSAMSSFLAPWASNIHLIPLISRQWKLSLMVVARYHLWLSEQQLPLSNSANRLTDDAGTSVVAGRNSIANAASSVQSPRSATPDPDSQARDDQSLKALAILAADALWFQKELSDSVQTHIIPLIADTTESMASEMNTALRDAFPIEETLLPSLGSAIVSILRTRCAEPLRLVRSLTTQYRSNVPSSSEPAQIEASYFVPQIFKPLRNFLGKDDRPGERSTTPTCLISEEYRKGWAMEVIGDVATRYAASLTQMIQNYESLRRLKRGNMTTGGGLGGLASSFFRSGASVTSSASTQSAGSSEDAEWNRMQGQMKADVARLEQDLGELSEVGVIINLEESEAWRKLRALVDRQGVE